MSIPAIVPATAWCVETHVGDEQMGYLSEDGVVVTGDGNGRCWFPSAAVAQLAADGLRLAGWEPEVCSNARY